MYTFYLKMQAWEKTVYCVQKKTFSFLVKSMDGAIDCNDGKDITRSSKILKFDF